MRRLVLLGVVVALMVVALPAWAQVAGCGGGFNLDTIADTVAAVDDRIYTPEEMVIVAQSIASEDRNGDGYLCWKHFKPNQGQDKLWSGGTVTDYVITLSLDNSASGRVSQCPAADGWEELTVEAVATKVWPELVDQSPWTDQQDFQESAVRPYDRDGDGLMCLKTIWQDLNPNSNWFGVLSFLPRDN